MRFSSKKESFVLFAGDLLCFLFALWGTLLLRYWSVPNEGILYSHFVPFSILFVFWFIIFFIAGLYERKFTVVKEKLASQILKAQIFNSIFAVLFFYFIPYFGITPKTNLFVYLFISFILVFFWRNYIFLFFIKRKKQNAILIGSGEDALELVKEINGNKRYGMNFVRTFDINDRGSNDFVKEIINFISDNSVEIIVANLRDEKLRVILSDLYSLLFSKVKFVDLHNFYEDIFRKIPVSLIEDSWFIENISFAPTTVYDFLKRLMDLLISIPLFVISIIFYPFIILGIKIDDNGPVFISQERIGKDEKVIKIYKFRSMRNNDTDLNSANNNFVTSFGSFLRKTRLDELPQLWNVIKGDLSLIGPRPELISGVKLYSKEVPYYQVRHLLKPGLSGWAQLEQENHPHHKIAISETREKLAFDLFYIKNRSFFFDLKIALKTIKKLLSRSGI